LIPDRARERLGTDVGSETKGAVWLGRYHCQERLSSGPLGEMFRARVFGLGGFEKDFAIRKLPAALCADEAFLQRFIAAANAAARLHGERIARVQEVDAEDGIYYVVSDLARGVDLSRVGRLARPSALCVVMDACDALIYAHGRKDLMPGGVLHLGLCPRSIMIGAEGELRVVDVGLFGALVQPAWTQRYDLQASLGYLAPEVVAGAGVGPQADVYSLGAILQELTGGAPDDPDLHALIMSTLAAEPAARPQSVLQLRERLAPFLRERVEARRLLAGEVGRLRTEETEEEKLIPDEPGTPPPLEFDGPAPLAPPPSPPAPRNGLVWGPEDLEVGPHESDLTTQKPSSGPHRAGSYGGDRTSTTTSTSTTTTTSTGTTTTTTTTINTAATSGAGTWGDSRGAAPDAPTRQVDVTPVRGVVYEGDEGEDGVTRPRESLRSRERGRLPTPISTPGIPSPPTLSLAALRRLRLPGWTRIAAAGGISILVVLGTVVWHRAFHRVALPPDPQAMRRPARSLFGRAAASEGVRVGAAPEARPASPGPITDVRSNPAGAHVFVDGALRGTTPLSAELPPGVHRVVIMHDRYKIWSRSTNAAEIAATLDPAELPPEVAGGHGLKIRCHTADLLRILIDGIDTGVDCPNQDKLELSAGAHKISLYNPLTDETTQVQRDVILSGTERSRRVYLKY
jgi:serine/threonine protein kinase